MRFLAFILSLIVATTAIDIIWSPKNCFDGPKFGCQRKNPGVCCENPAGDVYLMLDYIPETWYPTLHGFYEQYCKGEEYSTQSSCMNNLRKYKSGRYYFNRMLMSREVIEAAGGDGAGHDEAEKCHRVDFVSHTDGTKYAIDHLDDDELQYLVGQAHNGTLPAAVEELGLLKI